jgi:hypothetical protein
MRTRIKNVRLALPALLAVGAIAAAVAGCGGDMDADNNGAPSDGDGNQ